MRPDADRWRTTSQKVLASAIGQTFLTFGGTTNMLNLLEEAGLVIFNFPLLLGRSANIAIERDSILRIKIAGFVERLTVLNKKDRKIDGIDPWLAHE